MELTKLVAASVALVMSGWSFYEAGSSSQTLYRSQVRHRSAQDELRKMQAQPEESLALWVPGEFDPQPIDIGRAAPVRSRNARLKKAAKAPAGAEQERLSSLAAPE